MTSIDSLSLGFREQFLNHSQLSEQLQRWAQAFPQFARLQSLAVSEEGREVWLLTIGKEPERKRPAAWLDGNIHASELCGSSVCLAIAEDLLRGFAGEALGDLPAHVASWMRAGVLFHIAPRLSPDGAERVLSQRHFVRSNHRDHRLGNHGPYWRHQDVDGDGLSLLMRVKDATGDFVQSRDVPNLMLPRTVEDEGPFYRVYPEGTIERWDGFSVPRAHYLCDTQTDLNRNFPTDWRAEPEQAGAGPYPMSEPESRGVVAFAARNPNIFAWLSLHTFGGVYIRPLNDKPDSKLDPHDAAVFRLLETWAKEFAGYPTVSGFTEFTYEPDKPLHGDLANYAYVDRGAIGLVCELWDFWKQVGFEVKRPFIKNYEDYCGPAAITQIAAWDRDHNGGRMIGAWRPFEHPQLGAVEIGGYDPLVGVWNPPLSRLNELCKAQSSFFLRLAALAPRIVISSLELRTLDEGLSLVSAEVENQGFLPSYFLGSAKQRSFSDPVRASALASDGLLLEGHESVRELGHLPGWGGNDRSTTPVLLRSTGESPRRKLSWVVRGKGEFTLTVENTRTGKVSRSLRVGE